VISVRHIGFEDDIFLVDHMNITIIEEEEACRPGEWPCEAGNVEDSGGVRVLLGLDEVLDEHGQHVAEEVGEPGEPEGRVGQVVPGVEDVRHEGVGEVPVERLYGHRVDVAVDAAVRVDDLVPEDVRLRADVGHSVEQLSVYHLQLINVVEREVVYLHPEAFDCPVVVSKIVQPEMYVVVHVHLSVQFQIVLVFLSQLLFLVTDPYEVQVLRN